jgi:hypothetical protein
MFLIPVFLIIDEWIDSHGCTGTYPSEHASPKRASVGPVRHFDLRRLFGGTPPPSVTNCTLTGNAQITRKAVLQ